MNSPWPLVPLHQLLTRYKEPVIIDDFQSYTRLTIRVKGRGIVVRDRVSGHKIGTKRQFIARAGHLLLSRIDAQNGAFGVVPQACDGAIITANFWAFTLNPTRLNIHYLTYLTKTPLFIDFCRRMFGQMDEALSGPCRELFIELLDEIDGLNEEITDLTQA